MSQPVLHTAKPRMRKHKGKTSKMQSHSDTSNSREASSPGKRYLLGVFLVLWSVCLFHFNPSKLGSDRFVYVMMSIVERKTLQIDPYAAEMKDKVAYKGHVYSDVNPGLALMATPAWAVASRLYGRVSRLDEETHYALAHFVGFAASTALLSALGGTFLFALVYSRTRNRRRAWFATLLHAFGSINFYFSTFMHNNAAVAALTLMWFVVVYEPEAVFIARPQARWPWVGLLLGLMLLIDIGSIVVCGALICLTLRKMPAAQFVHALKTFVLPVSLLCLCQYLAFHNPFFPPQAYMAQTVGNAHSHGFWGIVLPRPAILMGMFLSPSVGLFLFMPYTLIAFGLLLRPAKNALLSREERFTVWLVFVAQWLFVGGGVVFQDQFGPRYLLPALALLDIAFGLCALVGGLQRQKAAVVLCASSLLINIAGAQIGVATNSVFRSVVVWLLRGPWLPLFTFITDARGHDPRARQYPIAPYAVFLLLAVLIGLIRLYLLSDAGASDSRELPPRSDVEVCA